VVSVAIIISLIFPLVAAVFVGLAALSWGVDTRPGFDERRTDERFGALR
jgi:hypothetical protein